MCTIVTAVRYCGGTLAYTSVMVLIVSHSFSLAVRSLSSRVELLCSGASATVT